MDNIGETHRHDPGPRGSAPRGSTAGLQFSAGAFQPPNAKLKSPTVGSATPPKPPKGRFFVVGMVLTVLSLGAFKVWDSFFRFAAYGVIEGRTIEIPSPVKGQVRYVHVQDGERVRQGQLLMSIDQRDVEQRLGRLSDELSMSQAKLDAGLSSVQWQLAHYQIEFLEASGEYREKWADVRERQVRWRRAQQQRQRLQQMLDKKTATQDEVEQAVADEEALRERLESLVEGLVLWHRRSQIAEVQTQSTFDQLQPLLAELKRLESEQARLREELALGEIRSPINGTVLKRHRFTGEGADELQTLITILEEDSLEAVLYVPQQRTASFQLDDTIRVHVAPFRDELVCRVVRFGDENLTPPVQIQRHYGHQAKLLPVHLSLEDGRLQHERLQIGAVVQLPMEFPFWKQTVSQQRNPTGTAARVQSARQ